jgi:hypothetical protein
MTSRVINVQIEWARAQEAKMTELPKVGWGAVTPDVGKGSCLFAPSSSFQVVQCVPFRQAYLK